MDTIRAYKDYAKIISRLLDLKEEEFQEITSEIEELCSKIIDLPTLIEQHNRKVNYNSLEMLKIDKNYELNLDKKNRVECLIELCFLVNKVTKSINLDDYGKKIFYKTLEKGRYLTIDGIKKILNKKYRDIDGKMKSKITKEKEEGLKEYFKLDKYEQNIFDLYSELNDNNKYFYEIKHRLLSLIIKEFANNPEKYKNYDYGFVTDRNGNSVFAINIPEHEGTYQFHITENAKDGILYDIDTIKSVKHPFEELINGEEKINKKHTILRKKDINNPIAIKEELNELKKKAKNYETKESILALNDGNGKIEDKNLFSRIFILSMILGKNPGEELEEANEKAKEIFVHEKIKFINGKNKKYKKTKYDRDKYREIKDNLRKNKKIFCVSRSIDTKVAAAALVKEAKNWGINEKEIKCKWLEGKKIKECTEEGIYINTDKNGYDNSEGKIKINYNEKMRQTSVCALLDKIGIYVPEDVVKYANVVSETACNDSRNAYLLLSDYKPTGNQIIYLCQKLKKQGQSLISASLTDDQLRRYELEEIQKKYEEKIDNIQDNIEYVLFVENEENKKIEIIKETKDEKGYFQGWVREENKNGKKEYTNVEKPKDESIRKKLAINKVQNSGKLPFPIAYIDGADYCISVKKHEEGGVSLAIQSNPEKSDLPYNLRRKIYEFIIDKVEETRKSNKNEEEPIKEVDDILNEKNRIVINRLKLKTNENDENENDEKYMDFLIENTIESIRIDEQHKLSEYYHNRLVEKMLEICKQSDINDTMRNMIDFPQKSDDIVI